MGPNRLQWTKAQLDESNRLLSQIPESYRRKITWVEYYKHSSKRHFTKFFWVMMKKHNISYKSFLKPRINL
jgi:hypothetical protein